MNEGCITNLPYESVVEVPCYVDGNGISIPKLGDLPLGCAAVCSQSIWVQKLAVEAAVRQVLADGYSSGSRRCIFVKTGCLNGSTDRSGM